MAEDTISGIATAMGEGGIGIVRISGENALGVAAKVFRGKKSPLGMRTHTVSYGKIIDENGVMVDEALLIVMRSPRSYTGEDVAELHCHGGMVSLKKVLALTLAAGARPAERGEFTKRAFLNGRIDLTQAQAVMDVVQAKTSRALYSAAGHLAGQFGAKVGSLSDRLLGIIALLEARIDFPEEMRDEDVSSDENVRENVVEVINEIHRMIEGGAAGRIVREGIMTAIVGRPNVGKSSLLNMLLGEERVIVTDVPGTTRDSIEETVNIDGVPFRLTDTAGIRATPDEVERIGINRAKKCMESAELLLLVLDGSMPITDEDKTIIAMAKNHKRVLCVLNKADLPQRVQSEILTANLPEARQISVSLKTGEGFENLTKAMVDSIGNEQTFADSADFPANERQIYLLERAIDRLKDAVTAMDSGMGEDFAVIDLRDAIANIDEITGQNVSADIIDEIFSRFCLGK